MVCVRIYLNMSNNTIEKYKNGGGVASSITPDSIKHDVVYAKFVRFVAAPNPDKCEMLGIPYVEEKKQYASRPTLQLFAEKFGVHVQTLYAWKKREEFYEGVNVVRSEWGKGQTADVLAALYRRCVQYGNAYDVELWLAYFENWDRKQVVRHVMDSFTADDLRTIISALPKEKQDEAYVKIGEYITLAELHGSGAEVQSNITEETGNDS